MIKSILNSSDKFIHLRYFTFDISSLLSGIKDVYFLIKWKGIYAEQFYGLERCGIRSKGEIIIDIVVWIVLPYLLKKL
jgi:hypothetical protein